MSSAKRLRPLAGTALAAIAGAGFALSTLSASLAYRGGSNPLTVAAFRFVVPTIVLLAWLRASRVPLLLSARDGTFSVVLGVLTALYSWALLSSFNRAPLALAILVFYLFPLLAALILALFGWERLSWRSAAAIVVAFAGLALALKPRGADIEVGGLALAFAAALGLAIVIVASSRMFKAGDARPLTLNIAAVSAVVLSALCAARGEFQFPATNTGWIGFAGAALSYGFAMIGFFVAVSMIGPVRASLLSYIEPVVTAGLSVVVLGEALTAVQTAGIALVVVALIAATVRPRRAPD